MLSTLFLILGIAFGIIFILFLAAVLVWAIFFKAIKGTSHNVKEIFRLAKEPNRKVSEIHTYYEENGVKKEKVEVMK